MPAIMRRTPQSEEAYGYGYVDFLKDVVQKTLRDTTAGFKRPTDFSDEEIMQMAFAGVGGGTKIAKGLGKGKFPFNLKEADFTTWENIFKRPAYHKKAKGLTARIDFMSPKEYFKLLESQQGYDYAKYANLEDVSKYAQKMREGAKFPLPGMEFQGGRFVGQEGRHRMLAARKLGIDRVPVLMVRGTPRYTIPKFSSTEEALEFGRTAPKEYKEILKRAMEAQGKVIGEAKNIYRKTKTTKDADEWIRQATKGQFYREAFEVM